MNNLFCIAIDVIFWVMVGVSALVFLWIATGGYKEPGDYDD